MRSHPNTPKRSVMQTTLNRCQLLTLFAVANVQFD